MSSFGRSKANNWNGEGEVKNPAVTATTRSATSISSEPVLACSGAHTLAGHALISPALNFQCELLFPRK
jgi:hypothetical protein